MSVDDWARERAERQIESIEEVVRGTWAEVPDYELRRESFAGGIVHAFDALLSDEAVENIAVLLPVAPDQRMNLARAALQAAIAAVTEGSPE